MTETKELQSSQEIKESNQYTSEDLDNILLELGLIEESFFGGDGKIGGEYQDTIIDEKYNIEIQKAESLQEKINIVEELISFFREGIDINTYDNNEKQYINLETQIIKDNVLNSYYNISSKYPDIQLDIKYFLQGQFDYINFSLEYLLNTNVVEEKYMGDILRGIYESLQNKIKYIEIIISYPEIKDKQEFIKNFIYLLDIGYYTGNIGEIDNKLNQVLSYNFIKNTDGKPLSNMLFIDSKHLDIIEKNYQNQDIDEILLYIDNNIPGKKIDILKIQSIQNMYIDKKEKELGLSNISSNIILNLEGLSKHKGYNEFEKNIIDYLKVDIRDISKIIPFIKYNNEENNFFKNSNLKEKYYYISLFEEIGNIINEENNMLDISLDIDFFKDDFIESIEDELDKAKLNKNDHEITFQLERRREISFETAPKYIEIIDKLNPQTPKTPSSKKPELSQTDSKINSLKQKYGNIAQELFNSEKISFDKNGEIKIDGKIDFLGGTIQMSKDGKDFIVNNTGCKREIKVDSLGNALETIKRLDKINKTGLSHLGDTMFDIIDSICNVRADLTYENIFYGNKINPFLGVLNQIIPTGYVDYSISPIVTTKEKYINDYLSVKINTDMDRVNTSGNLTITPRDLQRHIFNILRNI